MSQAVEPQLPEPSDREFAAAQLAAGQTPDTVHASLVERGLSAEAADGLLREAILGPSQPLEEDSGWDRWFDIGGGVLVLLGVALFVVNLLGGFQNESSIYHSVKLVVTGAAIFCYGRIR